MAYNKRDIESVRYEVPISQRLFREHRVIPTGTSIVDHVLVISYNYGENDFK